MRKEEEEEGSLYRITSFFKPLRGSFHFKLECHGLRRKFLGWTRKCIEKSLELKEKKNGMAFVLFSGRHFARPRMERDLRNRLHKFNGLFLSLSETSVQCQGQFYFDPLFSCGNIEGKNGKKVKSGSNSLFLARLLLGWEERKARLSFLSPFSSFERRKLFVLGKKENLFGSNRSL